MKKILAMLLVLLMAVGMVACGNGTGGTSQQPENTNFVRGEWTDNLYVNEFLNLKFTLPEGWNKASDEEIAEMMGLATEFAAGDSSYSTAYNDAKNVYDMVAQDTTNGTNIIVMAENLALSVGGTSYDEKAYADTVSQQLAAQENLDYTFAEEPSEISIDGETYLILKATLYDGQMCQNYLMRRVGKYMETIVITFPVEVEFDSVLAQFNSAAAAA